MKQNINTLHEIYQTAHQHITKSFQIIQPWCSTTNYFIVTHSLMLCLQVWGSMQTLTSVQKAPCNNTTLCSRPFRKQIINTVAKVIISNNMPNSSICEHKYMIQSHCIAEMPRFSYYCHKCPKGRRHRINDWWSHANNCRRNDSYTAWTNSLHCCCNR